MKRDEYLIRFEGIPTNYQHEEYPEFFPIRHWNMGQRYSHSTEVAANPEFVGVKAHPFEFVCELGLHTISFYDAVKHATSIKSAEFIHIKSDQVAQRFLMKDIQVNAVELSDPLPRAQIKVHFVFGRIRFETDVDLTTGQQGKGLSEYNMQQNNRDFDDSTPAADTATTAALSQSGDQPGTGMENTLGSSNSTGTAPGSGNSAAVATSDDDRAVPVGTRDTNSRAGAGADSDAANAGAAENGTGTGESGAGTGTGSEQAAPKAANTGTSPDGTGTGTGSKPAEANAADTGATPDKAGNGTGAETSPKANATDNGSTGTDSGKGTSPDSKAQDGTADKSKSTAQSDTGGKLRTVHLDKELRDFKFRLIDQDKNPTSGMEFEVEIEDGSLFRGKTNSKGIGLLKKLNAKKAILTIPDVDYIKFPESDELESELELEVTDSDEIQDVTFTMEKRATTSM